MTRLPHRGVSRRGFLVLAPLGLSACGLHPLYMPDNTAVAGPIARELAAINVPVMGERTGQLMRQSLQEHLERFNIDAPKRYDLSAPLVFSGEGVGIDMYSNVSRIRYVASTTWTLRRKDVTQAVVKSGIARIVDGVNIIGSQFFASDQETDQLYRSMANTLADQVVLQIAGYFDEQQAQAKKS